MKYFWNMISFQMIWWSQALLVPQNLEWIALSFSAGLLLIHWRWISNHPKLEFKVITLLALTGYLIDLILHTLGFFHLKGGAPYGWILVVWLGFSTTWVHSLRSVILNPWFLGLGSFIFGPLSYYASQELGLMKYNHSLWPSLFFHGVLWSILMFALRQILIHQSLLKESTYE
ncbi:MAG TPA: DUF2878 domain-containing protein [Pseudobdellovibrionaceae bacterium]|nr:DUF2878 domain-containing protein [Pseudobdellovibrionaceae bacterium]